MTDDIFNLTMERRLEICHRLASINAELGPLVSTFRQTQQRIAELQAEMAVVVEELNLTGGRN